MIQIKDILKLFPRQIGFLYLKPKKLKVKHSRFKNNLRGKNLLQCQQEPLSQFITYLICMKHDNKIYRSVSHLITKQQNRLYSPYCSTHRVCHCPGLISFTFCACSAVAEVPDARPRARPHHAPPPSFTNSLLSERYSNTMTKCLILITQCAARLHWLAKNLTLVGGRYSDRELRNPALQFGTMNINDWTFHDVYQNVSST